MKKYFMVLSILAAFFLLISAAYAAETTTWGAIKALFGDNPSPLAKAVSPQATQAGIERGKFVNRPLSSPPWYPDDCEESDNYRWAPTCHWADPSALVVLDISI